MKNHFQKRIFILGISAIIIFLSNCSSPEDSSTVLSDPQSNNSRNEASYVKKEFPLIDPESINIDTLYIQVAYAINENRWVLIARSIEDDPKGLKFMIVDPKKDFKLIYRSKGAYESLTLHPTFYLPKDRKKAWIILCNLGQYESWGQELFFMKGDSVNEIAYLDIAIKEEADSIYYESGFVLKDVSAVTSIYEDTKGIHFAFNTDSIMYFGSIDDKLDPVIAGDKTIYTYYSGKLFFELEE